MGYEVDIIGVGEESKSGDAIAIRWGDLYGPRNGQRVVIIDGGFRKSGQDLVNHIKEYYGTETVDAVISTHPDQDHVNGLDVVLDQLFVRQLWIHKPWEHYRGLAEKFADGRVTDFSLGQRLRESLESAYGLTIKAIRKGIYVAEPFAGMSLYNEHQLCVVGPTSYYYESLIPQFHGMPATKMSVLTRLVEDVLRKAKRFVPTWGIDQLDDEDTTSAKNNSSVITALMVEGDLLLFTGDAGVTALSHAAGQLESYPQRGIMRFMQIPHHGSRRNVGPRILNRLIGCPVRPGEPRNITAVASTAKNGEPKHPRKAVMNAFAHRGVKALATRGNTICYSTTLRSCGMAGVPLYRTNIIGNTKTRSRRRWRKI